MSMYRASASKHNLSMSVCFGKVPEVLKLFRDLLFECHGIAAILDDGSHCLVLQAVNFVDLLSVSVRGTGQRGYYRYRGQTTYAICAACKRDFTPTPFAIADVLACANSRSNRMASALLTRASCCATYQVVAIRRRIYKSASFVYLPKFVRLVVQSIDLVYDF